MGSGKDIADRALEIFKELGRAIARDRVLREMKREAGQNVENSRRAG